MSDPLILRKQIAQAPCINAKLPLHWAPNPSSQADAQILQEDSLRTLAAVDLLYAQTGGLRATGEDASEIASIHRAMGLLVGITARLLREYGQRPLESQVLLSSQAISWTSFSPPHHNDTGIVSVFLHPAYPDPLLLPVKVVEVALRMPLGWAVSATLQNLTPSVAKALSQLIFSQHRRTIAAAHRLVA